MELYQRLFNLADRLQKEGKEDEANDVRTAGVKCIPATEPSFKKERLIPGYGFMGIKEYK